ncbi:hypothetical protein A3A09_02470 [Candidatus Nomurabacteria bacterium RIFCSPLOWO2_01_FULL_42_20]|uniref:Uncharacterized protein n=1 Tax=Candidatus Nomurabacteria bacterium RIFCSPHIGHO2_01_FULL_42_16 TaxID=1801743 RepID=A0A1F6VK11_9BACT|nr:MAG: hypothetical protein A2824_00015 [Candidatus Nomurabacteria bacterium RIFCSPHIGHO2_01_FULL_42_16]OGI92506.1 MAG: hypothetical protein A3A09_02470 [Candidatus Nomurabacteria bacterium RIFCSPLOWO2_01_FULL_42_20]
MKELIPIGIVLLYDILIAMAVITLRNIKWRKEGPNPELDRVIAFIAIHLTFLLGIYTVSRTGYIAWFDNHVHGGNPDTFRTSFWILNMVVFPMFIWLKEKADPLINWKLLRNIAAICWLVPMVLLFFFPTIGCNNSGDDTVDENEYSIVQPVGFPKDIRLGPNEEIDIVPVGGFCYRGKPDEGNLAINEIINSQKFHLKAGPNGVHLKLAAVCKGNYHDPNLCPQIIPPTTIQVEK